MQNHIFVKDLLHFTEDYNAGFVCAVNTNSSLSSVSTLALNLLFKTLVLVLLSSLVESCGLHEVINNTRRFLT